MSYLDWSCQCRALAPCHARHKGKRHTDKPTKKRVRSLVQTENLPTLAAYNKGRKKPAKAKVIIKFEKSGAQRLVFSPTHLFFTHHHKPIN